MPPGYMVISLLVTILLCVSCVESIRFLGRKDTYAKFPKWNACINASLSFEFKTSVLDGLLMYTDDNGRYDFFQVALVGGQVRLWMNVADEKDGVVELLVGKHLNDGVWHNVQVKRNRMNTTLFVDNYQSSMMSFGADFQFGDIYENNYVFFGGLPVGYTDNLIGLALPSSMFVDRFSGEIRNILYFNCTCVPVRATVIESKNVSMTPKEACEENDPCPEDCPCVSFDQGPACGICYSSRECADEFTTRYHLPMDQLTGRNLENPSGLDSRVDGNPQLVRGVFLNALKLDGRKQYARVTGPGHKKECFGNLDHCSQGYYLAMWLQFQDVGTRKGVYLSNGGHRSDSHGIAMYYSKGKIEFVFKKPDGSEWKVRYGNLLENRWYHVAVTWSDGMGLWLYINGKRVSHDASATPRSPASKNAVFNDFVLGQANDRSGTDRLGKILVDEFIFMSMYKTEKELRESGPIYRYYLNMDKIRNDKVVSPNVDANINGDVTLVPGKIGNAISLRGVDEYVNIGNSQGICLGELGMCKYGFTISFWVSFNRLDEHTRYLVSSPKGVNIFYTNSRLHATASLQDRFWETYYVGIKSGLWYFLEVTWRRDKGLAMYIDGARVAYQSTDSHRGARTTNDKNFYIGRSNSPEGWQRTASAVVDDMEIFTADRDTLLSIDFIQRGRPNVHTFGMEGKDGNRLTHGSMIVILHGNPDLVEGKLGRALELNGRRQYADFGDHRNDCFGNLDKCKHGAMVAFWMVPRQFTKNAYFMSSGNNGITMWYRGKKVHISAKTSTMQWELSTDKLEIDKWYLLELTWSEDGGLRLYSNNQLIASSTKPTTRSDVSSDADGGRVYLGRGNTDMSNANYGNAVFDDMEYWFSDRNYLDAFGYIQRGKPTHYLIDMEEILGNRLVHPTWPIRVVGEAKTIPGKIGNALELKRRNQYLDAGDRSDECMGNLDKCLQGITVSGWMKFRRFENNMVYLSTGQKGLVMMFRNGYMHVSAKGKAQLSVPLLDLNRWYFVEISWHPDHGLEFYLDNKLKATAPNALVNDDPGNRPGSFYVGRSNDGDVPGGRGVTGNFDIDELEIWYGRRADLMAMDYIQRDNIGYETFFMDLANGNIVLHPKFTVTLVNGAKLVTGKIGNAVALDGRGQYVNLGEHKTRCMGNLDLCKHGLTISLWLNPRQLRNGDYFLSSPSYSLYFKDGKLVSKFHSMNRSWTVSSNKLRRNQWQLVTLSWHPKKGLKMLLNDDEVDTSKGVRDIQGDQPVGSNIFIAKAIDQKGNTADVIVDELQYWYDDLDQLRATGQYGALPQKVRVSFENYRGGYIVIGGRTIRTVGKVRVVPGRSGQAIYINGANQYIDLGQNFTCSGSLDSCSQGATVRFAMKPERLSNGMYFLDSFPVKVFYRNNRLHAEMQTADKKWEVSAPGISRGKWQQVELSWHAVDGLSMWLNGERVAHQTVPTYRTSVHNDDWRTFVGRRRRPGTGDRHINSIVEEVEVWNARREMIPRYPTPPTRSPDKASIGGEPGTITTQRPPIVDPGTDEGGTRTRTTTIIRFNGIGYVEYNFRRLPSNFLRITDEEEVSFYFLTGEKDGLIWLQEDNDRFMHMSMADGYLKFVNDEKNREPQEVLIRPIDRQRFNDLSWHKVKIQRKGRGITITVDGRHATRYNFPSSSKPVQFLVPAEVWLGGHPIINEVTEGIVKKGFAGGIAEVIYKTKTPDDITIVNLIAESTPKIHGGVVIVNETIGPPPQITPFTFPPQRRTTPSPPRTRPPPPLGPGPITFRSSNVYITLPRLHLQTGNTLSFKFQTIKEKGLMLYTHGNRQRPGAFMALEIYDGKLYFVYDFGAVSHRFLISDRIVADGQQHEVELRFYRDYLILMLDREQKRIDLKPRERIPISFNSQLYLGGYTTYSSEQADRNRLPWHVWSRDGYQGCIEDMRIDRRRQDLHKFVVDQLMFGNVDRQCLPMPRQCSLNQMPCIHGICRDTWNGYVCDCSNTGFTGRNCERSALVGSLNGNQFGHVPIMALGTHVNDISLRFLTPLSDAFLFQTYTGESDEYLRGELEGGKVKITTNLGGKTKTYLAGEDLNDLAWHTLYIRRRGNQIELWVDDAPKSPGDLSGENFFFNIERIYLGSLTDSHLNSGQKFNNYIGYVQNFKFNEIDVLNEVRRLGGNTVNFTISTLPQLPPLIYHPVTITSRNAYVELETLRVPARMVLSFMFKTKETSGVLLFNGGPNMEFIAVELYNGFLHFSFNTSDNAPALRITGPEPLNDNKWHQVTIRRNIDGKSYTAIVDGSTSTLKSDVSDARLDLQGSLYIGGLPQRMFQQEYIRQALLSRVGFKGCLASIDMSGAVPDLLKYAKGNNNVVQGCSDIQAVCLKDSCSNFGVCIPDGLSYYCNCNMTSFVGSVCSEEAIGFRFRKLNKNNGQLIYTFPSLRRPDSMQDDIALGFMTYQKNGVLMRINSAFLKDFIELRLENGHVVAEYNTDSSAKTHKLTESSQSFNDGNYHVIRFYRNSGNSSLFVDGYTGVNNVHTVRHDLFDKQGKIYIGGSKDKTDIINPFSGIIAGIYFNELRVLDKASRKEHSQWLGDVHIAPHPFQLTKPGFIVTQIPDIWETVTPVVPIDPAIPGTGTGTGTGGTGTGGTGTGTGTGTGPVVIPPGTGGGGVGWTGTGGGAQVGTIPGGTGGSGVMIPLAQPPVASAAVAIPPPLPGTGARAGAVVGTVLGIMALLSSLMWAFYRCKPGWCTCLKPAPVTEMSISPPRSTNLGLVQAVGGSGAGVGAGAGGAGMGGAGMGGGKVTVVNGSPTHAGAGGAGGGGSGAFSSYYAASSSSAAAGGGGSGGGAGYDSATLRATGTFSNKGTTIGTPKPARAHLGSSASAGSGYSSYQQSSTMRSVVDGGPVMSPASVQSYHYETGTGTADYDMAPGVGGQIANYQSNTLSAGAGSLGHGGYSTSTMSSNYHYQVQSVKTVTGAQQMIGYAGSPNFAVAPGAMGEEVRVDCCLITSDGKSVVTGSSLGPPQVWDMQSGELLRIMKGDTVGSTNLHLACNDRLLVGAVNAELEINQYSVGKGVTNRMLQIWDFTWGKPLEMAENEYCSGLSVMSDGDKVVFARTDKYGSKTSVIVWDLMGNQAIKEMRYDAPVGNNDYVSYLNLSQNDRYVLAGFNNTFDNFAEFVVFDMTLTSYNVMEPSFRRFDAHLECTAVLPRDEACTGLRNGDLRIWSLRTGEASRQLMAVCGAHAHSREIKAVALSEDGRFLVSASADGCLKVWDMTTERQIHTLTGHSDEVWCVAISPDSDIVVSGSRDGTIRLWRLRNGTEICSFSAGVDVFYVTMSHDKSTIVALGDKFGARKLIMLQVVRTKIRRQLSS